MVFVDEDPGTIPGHGHIAGVSPYSRPDPLPRPSARSVAEPPRERIWTGSCVRARHAARVLRTTGHAAIRSSVSGRRDRTSSGVCDGESHVSTRRPPGRQRIGLGRLALVQEDAERRLASPSIAVNTFSMSWCGTPSGMVPQEKPSSESTFRSFVVKSASGHRRERPPGGARRIRLGPHRFRYMTRTMWSFVVLGAGTEHHSQFVRTAGRG